VIGHKVNNYELTRRLGEGGMGAVYLAEHPLLGRKAAVKVLRPELASNQELVQRFLNEARAANAIHHPNIIDIIDVGLLPEGVPYMMMEFLDGESLATRLRRVPRLSVGEALKHARQTASALTAAHAVSIVHRDLKPDNLFVVPDTQNPGQERIKVLDFGIAKLRPEFAPGTARTGVGALMGTPAYMSPEQCMGKTTEIDHRADIYALGIILHEMLCGQPPFVGQSFGELFLQHITVGPAPLRSVRPDVSAELEAVVLKALEKDRKTLSLRRRALYPGATGRRRRRAGGPIATLPNSWIPIIARRPYRPSPWRPRLFGRRRLRRLRPLRRSSSARSSRSVGTSGPPDRPPGGVGR